VNFAETHFERNSRHTAWAKKMLEQRGFLETIVTAVQEKPLACVDVLRLHLRPVADRAFQEVIETDEFHQVSAFIDWLMDSARQNGMPHRVSVEAEILTQAIVGWHTSRFDINGRQSYVPSQPLSRLLLSTELRGLKCSDMTLPYPSLYISVDPELGFRVHNEQTGAHPLYGLYITDDSVGERRGWRILLCGDRNEASAVEWDDALSHFFLDFSNEEKPVSEAVAETFAMVRSKGPEWCRKQGMKDSDLEDIIDSWEASFKWAMNLLFYVTRPDFKDLEHVEANEEAAALWRRMQNAPKGSKKRERILDQYRAAPKRPRILVGRRVVVDERLPRSRAEAKSALMIRTLVPSHWQRYRTGPGRTEVVWKQKDPYWRGPEDAEPAPTQVHEVL
jgi:hypothetical protein